MYIVQVRCAPEEGALVGGGALPYLFCDLIVALPVLEPSTHSLTHSMRRSELHYHIDLNK